MVPTSVQKHLDEDTVTAFVEARLEEAEYVSAVSHLVDCGECRRTTAQLVRLEFELDESNEGVPFEESSSRISSFLSGLASNLIPSTEEDAVFAYQNPESEAEEKKVPEKSSSDSENADDRDPTRSI